MRIDDVADHSSFEKEPLTNATLVLPALATDELLALSLGPEDTSLEEVLGAIRKAERPIILVPQNSQLFTNLLDFVRLKETAADIVSVVLPRERMQDVGRYAHAQGFHFTSQLSEALAMFQQRSQQDPGLQAPFFPEQDTGEYPASPFSEHPPQDVPAVTTAQKYPPTRRRFLPILSIVLLLGVTLLPLLIQPPSTLTIPQQSNTVAAPATGSVGSLAFTSSGQLNPTSSTGSNDILSLDLAGLVAPHQGMSYFAWLLADKTQDATPPILLGKLSVIEGKAQLMYQEPQHRDMLVSYSRLLVTEQADNGLVNLPSLDRKAWRYQAAIPDVPTPGDETGYSLLSHLRHLLAQDPTLKELGLQGGLDIWLYRNTGKIHEWSSAARDDWASQDVRDLRNNVSRILEYLDGASYAFRDLPPGTPWLVDQHAGRPGLIDFTTAQAEMGPPSYVSHLRLHLTGMINAPDHTAEQQRLARSIDDTLTHIDEVLKVLRSDARKLAQVNDAQLKEPSTLTLLNDMLVLANTAYIGTTDLPTSMPQHGVVWVHTVVQSLATIPVIRTPANISQND